MKEYLNVLTKVRLFRGLEDDEIIASLGCLGTTVKSFAKGEIIFGEGEKANKLGIVISGELQTQKTDYNGNINIISRLYPPALVAGAAAFSLDRKLPFDIVAVCESCILFVDSENLTHPCKKVCTFHARIIENMLCALAEKNIEFSQKIDILTKRTIREKILSFLYSQSKKMNAKKGAPQNLQCPTNYISFSIGLSRRQMAEYLSVNRSALSKELSKMQDEGILEFSGNHFRIGKIENDLE